MIMKISFRRLSGRLAIIAVIAACDGGGPSTTVDEIADDSALAADLAIANRDTLLVDSIGEYRPPDAAERAAELDTGLIDVEASLSTATSSGTTTTPPARAGSTVPGPTPRIEPAPAAPRRENTPATATPRPARRTGTSACGSPIREDQSECVRVTLASTDMRLNRIYRALITEMRLREGVRGGQKDPPSVQRLRVAQRAWLVYRDTECRRRGRGREGALWARPRVRCLGQFSVRRANELADNFSRLTAR